MKYAEQAPCGQGLNSIVDTNIRSSWQIEASKVSIPSPADYVKTLVPRLTVAALANLGLDAQAIGVDTRLDKLYLYQAGSHFKAHRHSEQEPGE